MATPNEISEASPCYSCIEDKLAALLYLLNQIRIEGGGDVMTANEIAEASTCFGCIDNKESATLYLLEQIVTNGGGGGGGGAVTFGSVLDPNGNVTGSPGDIYFSAPSLGGDGTDWYKVSGEATDTGWE